jgi:hypothetical protein
MAIVDYNPRHRLRCDRRIEDLTMRPVTGVVRRRAAAWVVIGMLVAGAVGAPLGVGAAARLQDATDAGSVDCTLTEPPGTPTESADATPVAPSPVSAASPVAEAPAPGQPADAATAAEIDYAVRLLAACLTEGRSRLVAQLVTERYLGAVYGGGRPLSREDYLALARDLPAIPVAVSAVTDVRLEGSDRANADVVTVVGNQLDHGRWTFLRGSETGEAAADSGVRWLVDAEAPLAVEAPAGASRVGVGMTEYAFKLSPRTAAGPDVVLAGSNTGQEDHEMLVLRLDRGVSTEALLREPGPGLPDGVRFIGQVTVPAGTAADLVLVGLPRGTYVVVCLLPAKDGTPHLALGMWARLRVT